MQARPEINFFALIKGSGGKEGGRERFERLITQLVKLKHPAARRIAANPGDWGLDTVVGELAEGSIAVWQAKFFIDGVGASQQSQIREAFNQMIEKAAEKGFSIDSWTLCLPVSLDAPMTQWWDGWKKKMETQHGVRIQLWDDSELETLLLTADAQEIRNTYFGSTEGALVDKQAGFEEVVRSLVEV